MEFARQEAHLVVVTVTDEAATQEVTDAITGFYFNKDQLNAVQREQLIQGGRAADYSDELQTLENEHAALTASYNEMLQLLDGAYQGLPDDSDI